MTTPSGAAPPRSADEKMEHEWDKEPRCIHCRRASWQCSINDECPALLRLALDRALASEKERIEVLERIAFLSNRYVSGGCCDEHHTRTWNELCNELLKFEDDTFKVLKGAARAASAEEEG